MHAFLIAAALLPAGTKPLGLPIQRHQAADIAQVAVDLFRPYMRHDGMPIRWVVNREGVATQVRNRRAGATNSPPLERASFPKEQFKDLARYIAKSSFFRLEPFTNKRVAGWHMHRVTVSGPKFELSFQQNHQPTPKDVKLHALAVIGEIERRVDAITEHLKWSEAPAVPKGEVSGM